MVRESEKKFRGYHPELHAVPVAGVVRGTATEVHAGLPFVLEQHYNDVKGVEHERLLEQRGLASELRTMARRMEHAAAESRPSSSAWRCSCSPGSPTGCGSCRARGSHPPRRRLCTAAGCRCCSGCPHARCPGARPARHAAMPQPDWVSQQEAGRARGLGATGGRGRAGAEGPVHARGW
eukprot:COSAG04_NODE_7246_length_1160_cov_2.032045_2_plen_178_part_01